MIQVGQCASHRGATAVSPSNQPNECVNGWTDRRRTGSVWEGKSERWNERVKLCKEGVGVRDFVGDCERSTWRLQFQEAIGWLLSQIGCVRERAWQGWLVNSKAITVHNL